MRSQQRLDWFSMMALVLASAGCCCVQGTPGNCGSCASGGLFANKACAGGCGETYVDEWISDPPCVDKCCSGDCRPVRSLLKALWGSRFVNGCDMCGGCESGNCDDGCGDTCGYASAGGSGCTSCGGGSMGMMGGGGGCNCGGGGETVTAPMPNSVHHMQRPHSQFVESGEPTMVPGSYKVSAPRRVNGSVASERINPARQKIDAKRASFSH